MMDPSENKPEVKNSGKFRIVIAAVLAVLLIAECVFGVILFKSKKDLDERIDRLVSEDITELRLADEQTGASVSALAADTASRMEAAKAEAAASVQALAADTASRVEAAKAEAAASVQALAADTASRVEAAKAEAAASVQALAADTASRVEAAKAEAAASVQAQADDAQSKDASARAAVVTSVQTVAADTASKVASAKDEAAAAVQALAADTESKVAAVKNETSAAVQALAADTESKVASAKNEAAAAVQALAADTESKVAGVKAEAEAADSALRAGMEQELSDLRQENAALAAALTELQAASAQHEERLTSSEAAAAEYEARNAINIAPGDTVIFGRWEQDGNRDNGPENIEWTVLAVQKNKALIISRYALEKVPFSLRKESVTWEHSYLREWLNSTFIETAFTENEQAAIQDTFTDNGPDTGYKAYIRDNGASCMDKAFCLSYAEILRYFDRSQDRVCLPTAALRATGIVCDRSTGYVRWWLRSAGMEADCAADIYTSGIINSVSVDYGHVAVRPAMWVDTAAEGFRY